MKTHALIIVDIQNDFLKGGSLEVPNANEVIPVINRLQEQHELIVATQDWHPYNHKSFASQHTDKFEFDTIDLNGLEQVLWPDHCVQGTFGAEFHKDLNTYKIETIFRKGMDKEVDSYSGFYDNGRRKNTGLLGYLKDRNVNEVSIAGLASDFCVIFTANDALDLGFKTNVIESGSRPINSENWEIIKNEFVSKGGKLL